MKTCKYCGSTLSYTGNHDFTNYFSCEYCDMVFPEYDTCENRKRKMSVPDSYEEYGYYSSTKELLKKNTIELFHILKKCRADWYDLYNLLKNLMDLKEGEIPNKNEVEQAYRPLYNEYVDLTKKKFIIENIILEKAGFLPDKITEEFLNGLVEQGRKASNKPMYIYVKKG